MGRAALRHSRAVHPADARRREERPDPDERIAITVVVRARTSRDDRRKIVRELAGRLPDQRPRIGREEFVERFGATAGDLAKVAGFAGAHRLEVVETSPGRRCVELAGRIADVDRAFSVQSALYESRQGTYRSHENPVHVTDELRGIVKGVLGLDDRPLMQRHLFAKIPGGFTERRAVMQAYGFPEDADGAGERVGIISLGGGFHEGDLRPYLGASRLDVVELEGQKNVPADQECIAAFWKLMKEAFEGDPDLEQAAADQYPKNERNTLDNFKWTVEVTADVQNVARFAPGSDIVVYFAPNSMRGKYAALTRALVDDPGPSVISCSWGTHEHSISRNHAWLLDDVFEFAALRSVTLCFSSGDDGDGSIPTGDGQPPGQVCAHFPASSPHVLACGGTMWERSGADSREVVWREDLGLCHWASGGGVSQTFGPPWWQSGLLVEEKTGGRVGRGVPDVAGKADMASGYRVTVGGIDMPIGGTSSVAPLWAALIARLNQKLGTPIGYLTPLLYLQRDRFRTGIRDVTDGSNGVYSASEGWDACTGWGTPHGVRLLHAARSRDG